jgi:hypothetical protein
VLAERRNLVNRVHSFAFGPARRRSFIQGCCITPGQRIGGGWIFPIFFHYSCNSWILNGKRMRVLLGINIHLHFAWTISRRRDKKVRLRKKRRTRIASNDEDAAGNSNYRGLMCGACRKFTWDKPAESRLKTPRRAEGQQNSLPSWDERYKTQICEGPR